MFNIRVYGIYINWNNEVLLSKETYSHYTFLKFPGGGLEYGEGTADCLKREFKEEANLDLKNYQHFYTTDFFQKSIMDESQVISIYYTIEPEAPFTVPLDTDTGYWDFYPLNDQLMSRLDLPIDKVVAGLLLNIKR